MTLTIDSCAVTAKNLAVGMKILLAGNGWVTITDISQIPPSAIRIDFIDAKGVESWFMSGNEARQQVLSSSQIPA
tara:strand:+ start:201 stop:425 length:225 start_codon:yes stop_codon:yes gene_type:complete